MSNVTLHPVGSTESRPTTGRRSLVGEDCGGQFLQFRGDEMANERFTIIVRNYLLGQFRIHITDLQLPDSTAPAGHGSIVQQLCTYNPGTLACALTMLRYAPEPLELARSWATPGNCERPGGRIRLDNEGALPRYPITGKATV